ncbi:MAG: TRAP transporter large permease [Desulfarculaceae bacterium]|jgi:tripartite ATP-independent transporter DctM subunit
MVEVVVGAIGIIALLVLILAGIPIGIALLVVGFVGFAYLVSPVAALSLLAEEIFLTLSSYSLAVLPLFFLMGQLAYQAGMSKRLFATAYSWMGHLPGGLAMAAVGGCAGFSAISGSSSATAATMGLVALPEMRKYKYNLSLATGSIAAGGTLGILIPPSVVLIIYGIQTEQSIGRLFVAGILPGILLASLFIVTIFIFSLKNRDLAPQGPRTSFKEKLYSLPGALEALILFGLVMGGLLAGWFTPTEAGGVGSLGALIIGLVRRKLKLRDIGRAAVETALVVAMLFLILAGAMMFGKFLAVSRIPTELAEWAVALPFPKIVILILVMAIYALGGCIMDALSFLLVTISVFFPMVVRLGYDPIWFGVIIVILLEMGAITPPVGINVYVIKGVAPDVDLGLIFKGVFPFFLAMILCVIILILWPSIALVLPSLC